MMYMSPLFRFAGHLYAGTRFITLKDMINVSIHVHTLPHLSVMMRLIIHEILDQPFVASPALAQSAPLERVRVRVLCARCTFASACVCCVALLLEHQLLQSQRGYLPALER